MNIENIKSKIKQIDIVKFKEALYYVLIFLFSIAILFIMVFKTELLTGKWLIGGVVVIILIILKQLFEMIKKEDKHEH